jgi:hypothetical protein
MEKELPNVRKSQKKKTSFTACTMTVLHLTKNKQLEKRLDYFKQNAGRKSYCFMLYKHYKELFWCMDFHW